MVGAGSKSAAIGMNTSATGSVTSTRALGAIRFGGGGRLLAGTTAGSLSAVKTSFSKIAAEGEAADDGGTMAASLRALKRDEATAITW